MRSKSLAALLGALLVVPLFAQYTAGSSRAIATSFRAIISIIPTTRQSGGITPAT